MKIKRRQAWSYESIDAALVHVKLETDRMVAIHKASDDIRIEITKSFFAVIKDETERVTNLMEMIYDLQEQLALVIASTDREIANLKLELLSRDSDYNHAEQETS